ncbi:pilus assembly protein PilM [Planctomycetota bacterium]
MKPQIKTVLGIEISFSEINLALLRKDKKGLKLLKTASCPVPDGAIKDGDVEDAAVLAKAVKQLIVKNKMRTHHAVFSAVLNPLLIQILNIPNDARDNIGQFIQNEIKQYATLSLTKIASDYCGIKSPSETDHHRAFVAAADSQKIIAFIEALEKEGLNVDAIEPFSMAYFRACYAKKIANKFDHNLLFAILRDNILTLCVFKNQILDFIEIKQYEADNLDSDKCFEWVIKNINAALKFYELRLHDKCDQWEVNLVTSISNKSVKEKIESLTTRLKTANPPYGLHLNNSSIEIEIINLEEAYLDTPVADTKLSNAPSAIAVGLAMKLMNFPNCGMNVNLLLPELVNTKPERKHALIIANIAAVIFLLAVLTIGFFDMRVKNIKERMNQKHDGSLVCNISSLLSEQASLNVRTSNTTENLKNMSTILNTKLFARWDQALNEIRYATPEPVRVVNIFSNDGLRIILKGHAFSYESIHLFVEMLNGSEYLKLVSLIGTEKDSESTGLVAYSISCSLVK